MSEAEAGFQGLTSVSPLESVADMRTTAKWIVAAAAGASTALLGAAPLAALGKVHGIGDAVQAFAGLCLALAGLGWVIWQTAEALIPPITTLASLREPRFAGLRERMERDPGAFFGAFGDTVDELVTAAEQWRNAYVNTGELLDREEDQVRRRILERGLQAAQANADQAGARLTRLVEFAHAWQVRERLRRARLHAFAGAVVAVLGAVVFATSTGGGTQPKPGPAVTPSPTATPTS
jgi:hypothetical protein